jgi:hypothetical protein
LHAHALRKTEIGDVHAVCKHCTLPAGARMQNAKQDSACSILHCAVLVRRPRLTIGMPISPRFTLLLP